jgi:hypothetical protein
LNLNWKRVANDDLLDDKMQGRYNMTFHECTARGKGPISVKWAQNNRQHLGITVSDSMKLGYRM